MKKTYLAICMTGLLTGCLSGGSSSPSTPALDRSESLLGPDSNQDGVRDDIEMWINQSYSEPKMRSAAMQEARAMQQIFNVDPADQIAVKEVARRLTHAINCVYDTFLSGNPVKPSAQVSREIESITTNTRARLERYLAFNKALDGTTWSTPRGDTCD